MTTKEAALAAEIASATALLIAALPAEQRDRVCLPYDHAARMAWDSGPRERAVGVRLNELAATARPLVDVVLSIVHSPHGQRRIWQIRSLETILGTMEGGRAHRDPDRYWVQCFGDPSQGMFTLRVEGHHCSINVSVRDGQISATPMFRATNPSCVPDGPRAGWRVLDREEDAGRNWIRAMSDKERNVAISREAPTGDLRSGTAAQIIKDVIPRAGIAVVAAMPSTRACILGAADAWLEHFHPVIAAGIRERCLPTNGGVLHAQWCGGTEPGQPHSWRISGGVFLLEFAMAQNAGNHIHAVLREAGRDFLP